MTTRHSPTNNDLERSLRLARNLQDMSQNSEPELFDDAESNMDMNFNKRDLDFPSDLECITHELEELRRWQEDDPIIADQLKIAALNTYIENAMILAKRNNLLELADWEEMSDLSHHERRDRELLETSLAELNRIKMGQNLRGSMGGNNNVIPISSPGMDYEKNRGLLELAKKGELFDIKIDNIYKQVGSKQVENFARIYGVHRE